MNKYIYVLNCRYTTNFSISISCTIVCGLADCIHTSHTYLFSRQRSSHILAIVSRAHGLILGNVDKVRALPKLQVLAPRSFTTAYGSVPQVSHSPVSSEQPAHTEQTLLRNLLHETSKSPTGEVYLLPNTSTQLSQGLPHSIARTTLPPQCPRTCSQFLSETSPDTPATFPSSPSFCTR